MNFKMQNFKINVEKCGNTEENHQNNNPFVANMQFPRDKSSHNDTK